MKSYEGLTDYQVACEQAASVVQSMSSIRAGRNGSMLYMDDDEKDAYRAALKLLTEEFKFHSHPEE